MLRLSQMAWQLFLFNDIYLSGRVYFIDFSVQLKFDFILVFCFFLHFSVFISLQVHSFWKMPDADLMDNVVFTLPIMKELGDQVQITTKTITCL